jgi:rRNA maturation endonuclease Nob1
VWLVSLRKTLSTLFRPPRIEYYRCQDCGRDLGEPADACPSCGGDHVTEAAQTDLVYYEGGM